MTLTEMRRVLAERGVQLTKSLGQNFLHDANQLRRIVELAEVQPADQVLEIGPGLGPLTEQLLATGASVLALEKDARLVGLLRERLADQLVAPDAPLKSVDAPASPSPKSATSLSLSPTPTPPRPTAATAITSPGEVSSQENVRVGRARLDLRHADALEVVRQRRDWAGWKVVANLPYSVASPILVELALSDLPPARLVVTLQSEVARRLMAGASDEDYGVLSLLIQLRFEPRSLFRIPAACFFPAPDVESACVRLDRRAVDLLPAELQRTYCRVVKRAFSQRRKMMMKLLRADWPSPVLERAFAEAELPVGTRAEAVGLEQFIRLTKSLAAPSPP
jgi:16S rRNA (adenine1518-N6/adenine1519-N6)-dimethyltransferase